MREELEQKLMDEFPFMEAKNVWTDRKLGFPMGCECEDGWFDLIYNCCKEIDELYKQRNKDSSEIKIYQIKEKYGALCIYLGNYIDGVSEIVNKYEDESVNICEICGQRGKVKINGSWLKTLCDKHAELYGYKNIKERR